MHNSASLIVTITDQLLSEWMAEDASDQYGTDERIREKMLRIRETTTEQYSMVKSLPKRLPVDEIGM